MATRAFARGFALVACLAPLAALGCGGGSSESALVGSSPPVVGALLQPYAQAGIHPRRAAGELAVVRQVGHPDPNLSRFESTDTWSKGRRNLSSTTDPRGWIGRTADLAWPGALDVVGVGVGRRPDFVANVASPSSWTVCRTHSNQPGPGGEQLPPNEEFSSVPIGPHFTGGEGESGRPAPRYPPPFTSSQSRA